MQTLLAALAVALAAGCLNHPPQRDVFVPPYAAKGCWARLYAGADFAVPMRQLEGPNFVEAMAAAPVVVPDMEGAPPQPLFREVTSVEVGPHAELLGYAEPLFREPSVAIGPGSRVPDLAALEFHPRVESFELRCEA